MDLNEDIIRQIEDLLDRLKELDPAELPDPAAQLASLLGDLLEGLEGS